MDKRRVTIVDIARELGISKTLVSNALHGRGRVSDATREAVRSAAQRMGYVSNRAAQQLRGSRYGTVGLCIPGEVRALSFYMQLLLGISDTCARYGSNVMLYTALDEHSNVTLSAPVDGVIVCDPMAHDSVVTQMTEAAIPVVTVGHVDPAQEAQTSGSVSIDYDAVLDEIFASLHVGDQYVAPVLVGTHLPELPVWLEEVRQAFARNCRARNLPEFAFWMSANHSSDVVRDLVDRVIAAKADLIIVAYQGLAATLRALLAERVVTGCRLPQVVALPGDPMSDLLDPRILSVDFRAHEYGVAAARLLHQVLDGSVPWPRSLVHEVSMREE
ncbi:LacI family DNA-binding transcriptional regulator [Glutamicibacter endophyticus]